MNEHLTNLLTQSAATVGVQLTARQATQFLHYKDLLLEWNEKINLTAITDESEVMVKHFADSLSLAPFLQSSTSLIDIGTGAGFPGLPLKISLPNLNVTLLDSLNKRLMFVNEVISALELNGITTIHSRAEDGARKELREKFDYATARAVSRLSVLAEYCLPYVKIGGTFIAYKGVDIADEISEAIPALKVLGGEVTEIKEIKFNNLHHSLIMLTKYRQTPLQYPRPPAKIAQSAIK